MQNGAITYIIGDKLEKFCKVIDAITISRFEVVDFSLGSESTRPTQRHYILGQGVSEARYRACWERLNSNGRAGQVTLDPPSPPKKASRLQTHKHQIHNILIGHPEKLDATSYQAKLLIDDRCDDISDHLTGFHIPGMCILEAARQMILAVSEEFIARPDCRGLLRFSTKTISASFHGFVLPTPADLVLRTQKVRTGPGGDFVLTASVDVVQMKNVLVHIDSTVSAISRKFVENREQRLVASISEKPAPVPVDQAKIRKIVRAPEMECRK